MTFAELFEKYSTSTTNKQAQEWMNTPLWRLFGFTSVEGAVLQAKLNCKDYK